MREYGKVYSSFWQSPGVRAMSEDGRTLALYLLTTPHGSVLGCFRMPDAYAAEDLQWSAERVSKGFRNLIESQFLVRDEVTKWLFIPNFLKWNQFDNPNVAKAAHRAWSLVPDCLIKQQLAKGLLEFGAHLQEPFRKGCETLLEQFRNKAAYPEPEPEPIRSRSRSRSQSLPGAGNSAPGASPPVVVSDGIEAQPKSTSAAWGRYSSAYQDRYGTLPVRNAKVNGQLANLVARLGESEAPGVAAFYVGHQRADYVRAMHPVDFLVRDCESLRTAWATGKQVTNAQAIQEDRTQTNLSAFSVLIAEAREKERANGE